MSTEEHGSSAGMELEDFDRDLDFGRLAEQLAELSQPSPLPSTAVPNKEPLPFQPDEVVFSTNDWLQRVLDVQCWLRLDATLSLDSDPVELAGQLFASLGREKGSECFEVNENGNVRLTALGIQNLDDRLSRACTHRSAFESMLEDDQPIKVASDAWVDAWEDYEAPPRPPIAINADVAQWKIKDFRDWAREGKLDLNPSYQRDIVWTNTESQMLIESILRGIPLPSVILSQTTSNGRRSWQIVDGKQRLTAVLRFMGHHPEGRAHARALGDEQLFDSDFKKFARKHHLKPADIGEKFLPFKLKTFDRNDPLFELSGKYYYQIKDEMLTIGGQQTSIEDAFESVDSSYKIPVLLYRDTQIHDIHHVFGLYNKQGKKLNAEELRNAVYHHVDLMRLALVLSGDRPSPDELAPYLPSDLRQSVSEIGSILSGYNFGVSRFKRTKVLCWMLATMLQERHEVSPGQLATPSTAAHINSMLDEAGRKGSSDPLAKTPGLVALARAVDAGIKLHCECESAWASTFRNKKGVASKWEELPLVGSLLACVIITTIDSPGSFKENLAAVRSLSEAMRSPDKTQNKTQWKHIAGICIGVLRRSNIDLASAGDALNRAYGFNCIPTLEVLAA